MFSLHPNDHPVKAEEHSNSLAKSVESEWGVFDAETHDNKLVDLAIPNKAQIFSMARVDRYMVVSCKNIPICTQS